MPKTGTDKDLQELAQRIGEARREAGLLDESPVRMQTGSGRGMQAGFELAVAVIVCTFLGVGLDRWMVTKPLFMLLGLLLGFAAGMWSLYRSSLDPVDTKKK